MKTKTTKTIITRTNITTTETKHRDCRRGRAVECIETGEIFPTQAEASRAFGCTDGAVWNQLNGYQTTLKGFTFRYVDRDESCVMCRARKAKRGEVSQTRIKAVLYDLHNELKALEEKQGEIQTEINNIQKQIRITEARLDK